MRDKCYSLFPMLVQAQHRFSVADYYRMAETGVLKHDARVELEFLKPAN